MLPLPSSSVAFKVLLTVNLASAIWNIISDCDETYNYWEPLHFLLYGSGFQTWEYSPKFAIRSYAYLWIYGALGRFLAFLNVPKLFIFYAVRLQCCAVMSVCQAYLYVTLRKHAADPIHTAFTLLFSALSSGSFISSSAFLPSSFAMYCSYISLAAWIDRKYKVAVLAVAVSAVIGWPFSAALGLPLVFDMLFIKRKLLYLLSASVISGVAVTLPMMAIDSYYFGKAVVAPLNILSYNVFSSHGSALYGTEPFAFYIQNYFLNFNIGSLIAYSLPSLALVWYALNRDLSKLKLTLHASPFFVWNVIFFMQPHKEERFLFPCYPFLCYGAGLSVSIISLGCVKYSKKVRLLSLIRNVFICGVGIVFIALSVSRVALLVFSFRGPLMVYGHLPSGAASAGPSNQTAVCVGKEWYRFPNSFFLKPEMELHFIKSDFAGQLPAKYSGRKDQLFSRVVHDHFNELNGEELSRYVDLAKCDFLIDKDDVEETKFQPRYSNLKSFRVILRTRFLDAAKSTGIFKSFYVPFLYETKNSFVDYLLLMRLPGRSV